MTGRQRLLTVLRGEIPDCVPVAPDFSNMIPARRTGKPFWDIYLYNDPPLWQAYIDCAKYFDTDAMMDFSFPYDQSDASPPAPNGAPWERFIIFRDQERIITQSSYMDQSRRIWSPMVDVYYIADPPTLNIPTDKLQLPAEPTRFEPLEGVKPDQYGSEGMRARKERLGEHGLVGYFATSSAALRSPEDIYHYYDNPDRHEQWAAERVDAVEQNFKRIMAMETKPDFICVGGSGTLVYQTVEIFRRLALPAVKRAIELASQAGLPTHMHSCGPEAQLVKIMAEETALTVIDPLEVAPMGDCSLAELKRLYGNKIVLKGNLHTTEIMLKSAVSDVVAASKRAIDDAAAGGRFILSTGDQCGRDTPDDNLHAMIETARTYGRY